MKRLFENHPHYSLYRKRSRQESGSFIQAEHDIHVLDGLAGSTFNQVIDCGNNDEAIGAFIQPETDITIVGPFHVQSIGKASFRA